MLGRSLSLPSPTANRLTVTCQLCTGHLAHEECDSLTITLLSFNWVAADEKQAAANEERVAADETYCAELARNHQTGSCGGVVKFNVCYGTRHSKFTNVYWRTVPYHQYTTVWSKWKKPLYNYQKTSIFCKFTKIFWISLFGDIMMFALPEDAFTFVRNALVHEI